MNTATLPKTRTAYALVTLASTLALTAATTSALADVTSLATPTVVEYSAGTVLVQLPGGTNYNGVLSAASGCTGNNQNADTLKAWTSLAQAALLSGKSLKIYYTPCAGTNYINTMDLWQ
jgi:hypothetical protein